MASKEDVIGHSPLKCHPQERRRPTPHQTMTAPPNKNSREDDGYHSTKRPTAKDSTLSHARSSLDSLQHPLSGRIFTRTRNANPTGMDGTLPNRSDVRTRNPKLVRESHQSSLLIIEDQTTPIKSSDAPRITTSTVYPSINLKLYLCDHTQRTSQVWNASAKARKPIPDGRMIRDVSQRSTDLAPSKQAIISMLIII